ncbi:MAG: CAAX prenyl protease-related protein, partial [Planctomycetota bacterium]
VVSICVNKVGVELNTASKELLSYVSGIGPQLAKGIIGERSSFNPLEQIEDPRNRYAFIAVRMLGLSLFVPLFEELMLRGWLMRMFVSPNLWRVPFGRVTTSAVIVGTAFPMLTHPEKLAALVWFSLITWLMVRTKNFWDCVVAHAVTNFLLGVYVLWTGTWHLW